MKKLVNVLLSLLLCAAVSGCGAADAPAEKTIVTSFYPMYVFTQNVTKDIPDVRVVNMADQSAGCLHDYQLQTRDMVMLEEAFALVINGGGMEQFVEKIAAQYPALPVINAGEGIEMLCSEDGHDHEGHEEHDHGEVNAHVWLDPKLAIRQVQRIADGLALCDAVNAETYQANAAGYIERLAQLDREIAAQLESLRGSSIITFHEAFAYFANAYGLVVEGVISNDSGEEPSTRQIARTCDLVKEKGVKALFIEPQYPAKSAETIARETGALVFTLDPVVSGDGSPESYEVLMRKNAQVLVEALR